MVEQQNNEPDFSDIVKKHLAHGSLAEQLGGESVVIRIWKRLKR